MGSAQSSNNKQNGVTTIPHMEKQKNLELKQQQQQLIQPLNSNVGGGGDDSGTTSKESGGGCPMKLSDGSYQMNWKAMFKSSFPHNIGGSKPLTAEQVKINIGTEQNNKNDNEIVNTDAGNSGGGGCPMKQSTTTTKPKNSSSSSSGSSNVEYNVYSEPMDPNNNMPSNPNQLPAPTQLVSLSTERVPSSIPKVNKYHWVHWF